MVCSQNSKQLFLFSKSKLQLLETVFRLHFSKISFQPSVVFVAWLRTVVLSNFQWVRHTYPVQALNVARLHLAVLKLGGCVLTNNCCACCYKLASCHTSTFWVHVQKHALTEGQHRPKAGKKKKTREAGLFFLVPTSQVMLHPKWVKKPFPDPVSIIHIRLHKLSW